MTMGDEQAMQNRSLRIAGKFLLAALLGTPVLLPAMARAELSLSAGVEYLSWKETTTPEVTESGPLYALGIAYSQDIDAGALFAYRGKLWGGSVDYDGATLFGGTPVESTTDYIGASNELQARWRKPGSRGGSIDGVLGVGLDVWRRSLSSVQNEDYAIGYLRLGLESGTVESSTWSASLGVKYPFWTYENAHFDEIGFDSNPILRPRGEISAFGSLGYRFTPTLQLVTYYEGFRFGKSDPVQTNEVALGLGPTTLVQPATNMSIYGIKLEYVLR
jgi:hypothetical protein